MSHKPLKLQTMTDLHFNTEAETEKAILDCIAKGIKFAAVGRTHIIIFK